jgi:hypothetical protein
MSDREAVFFRILHRRIKNPTLAPYFEKFLALKLKVHKIAFETLKSYKTVNTNPEVTN